MRYLSVSILCAFSVALFSASGTARAAEQSTHSLQRMIMTESATPIPAESIAFTFGLDYTRQHGQPLFNNHWAKDVRQTMRLYDWTLGMTYGMSENVDMRVKLGWADIKDGSFPFADDHGRGLKDAVVGLKIRFQEPEDGVSMAYIPELTVPIGQNAKTGRLGPGRDHWVFDQTLALTSVCGAMTTNVNLSHSLPFGRTRDHYSMPFMNQVRKTRGVTGLGIGVIHTEMAIQPMAELAYLHEWVSRGNDSDLVLAGIGARTTLAHYGQLQIGYQYPVIGRNTLRAQTVNAAWILEF